MIGVVGHVARLGMAETLAGAVGAEFVSIDDGTLGCEGNHRRVWLHLSHYNDPWSVVLEDDAVPVPDFRNQLQMVLASAPSDVVSLYLGTSRPVWYQPRGERVARRLQPAIAEAITRAEATDAAFITSLNLFHAVAVAIRTPLVQDMLNYTIALNRPIDYAISDWCEARSHTVAYTAPSIVEHRDSGTLFIHPDKQLRNSPRVAHRFGARNHWHTKAVDL